MLSSLEESAATAGLPRHCTYSYEHCRVLHPRPISPIPISREASACDAAPRHFCRMARGIRRQHSYESKGLVVGGCGAGFRSGRGRVAPAVER